MLKFPTLALLIISLVSCAKRDEISFGDKILYVNSDKTFNIYKKIDSNQVLFVVKGRVENKDNKSVLVITESVDDKFKVGEVCGAYQDGKIVLNK